MGLDTIAEPLVFLLLPTEDTLIWDLDDPLLNGFLKTLTISLIIA